MEQLRTALALYANDNNGNLPTGAFWSNQASGSGNDFDISLLASLSPYLKSLPHDPKEIVGGGSYGYFFTNSFYTTSISSGGAAGTCGGKAIIMIYQFENITNPRHECTLFSGTEFFPNALVIQLN
jgi:hypothetical protein